MANQYLVFDGYDSSSSFDASLYLYDGTTVTLLTPPDAYAGSTGPGSNLSPIYLAQLGNQLVFDGVDTTGTVDLWVSDGTSAGTVPVTVSAASTDGLQPIYITTFGSNAYFNGVDTAGNNDLWSFNGTTASIVTISNSDSTGLNPQGLTAANGALYFYGLDSQGDTQVFAFDGTTANVLTSATDTSNFALGGSSEIVPFKQGVLFVAAETTDSFGLYYSTGTAAGTTEIVPGSNSLFTNIGGTPELSAVQAPFSDANGPEAVFTLPNQAAGTGTGLWVTDGTVAGTQQLGPIANVSADGFNPTDFVDYNGKVYFGANDAAGLNGLWVTDGTAAGTTEIAVNGASTNYGVSPDQLAVENGKLYFSGLDTNDQFDLWSTDGTTAGTKIIDGTQGTSPYDLIAATLVACYCTGTLITTEDGETPVEALSIGDRVMTASGALRPIRWVGRRSYAGRFLAGRGHLLPILIRAGALGDGLPRRDLRISPSHAMFIDGLLVPAHALVNGWSIVQETAASRVDYVHIELAEHDVILAEGAPSETFLDDGSRGIFHNAAEYGALYPGARQDGRFCAPRVESGYALEAIRDRHAGLISGVLGPLRRPA